MARSDVSASEWEIRGTRMTEVVAKGGTRRERGAAIAAYVRQYPQRLDRYHISYSETYGFLSATYTRYTIVGSK
jgi:hypothetical protein